MANKTIEDIEGIGPATGEKLRGAGVKDTDALLEKGCTKSGRKGLAEASGLGESQPASPARDHVRRKPDAGHGEVGRALLQRDVGLLVWNETR